MHGILFFISKHELHYGHLPIYNYLNQYKYFPSMNSNSGKMNELNNISYIAFEFQSYFEFTVEFINLSIVTQCKNTT